MGIKKKKHLDKVVFSLSLDTVFENERNMSANRDEALKIIQQIVCSDDGKQQMTLFKEVESVLLKKQSDPLIGDMAISLLGKMYYQINSRSTLKRTASSVLQGLAVAHPTLVLKTLSDNLKIIISISSAVSISHIKDTTEQLLTLCDNFPVGKLAIDENCVPVLEYINFSMSTVLQAVRSETSPQRTSDLYSVCQSMLKLMNLILQQCSETTVCVQNSRLYLRVVLSCVIDLLNDECTLLNCRINAGIAFSLLLRYISNKDSYVAYISHHNNIKDLNLPQTLKKFPAISQLCVWSGVMAVLSVNELIYAETECLLFSEILNEIIQLSQRKEDTVIISSSARALLQWLDVAGQMLNSDSCTESIREKFHEDSVTNQVLLQYVWTNWEHFMDCVQYHTRDIFRRIITLHIQSQNINPKSSSFLRCLCHGLLEMPWHRRGKYSILCCLAEHLGTTVFIELRPSLPDDLYHALCDGSLASHVSELCDVLFKSSNSEYDKNRWEDIWLRPLINAMCNATKPQKCGLTEHVLPKLFVAYPPSVGFLVSELSSSLVVQTGNCFSALIACGKVAQKFGVYKNSNECCDLWCGCIPKEVLEGALCHADDQVRLSAFSLICDSPKTTECLTSNEFHLLKTSLPFNINIQCPAFRQQFVSFIKKFLLRVKESAHTFLKKSKRGRNDEIDVQKCVKEYQKFLLWMKNFLFFCLHPSANFPRRVTALSLLSLYCNIFSSNETSSEFEALVTKEHQAQTLLEALKDTYEDNKQRALDILSTVEPELIDFQNKHRAQEIFEAGLLLSSSTKPPDSVTASFLFALLTQHDLFSVVSENMAAFKENEFSSSVEISLLDTNHEKDVSLAVICVLCIHMSMHLNTARKSLLEASAKCPLYGVLICVRKILSELHLSSVSRKRSIHQWQVIFSRLISLCFEVVSLVEPVVCNSSPEGHLPMDTNPESIQQLQEAVQNAISGRYQNAIVNTDNHNSSHPSIDLVKTKAVTAQMLLLCCWRAHKEVSLLLGWICENVPISDPHKEGNGMLSTSQIMEIGHFFIRQLCVLKHRGGFEQAYVGFCKLCHRLWRSTICDLHKLPQEWLQQLFSTIRGEDEGIHLCPTRRSAGLPFIFQALLVSELDVTGSSCFKQAMTTLLDLAQPHLKKYSLECQVHAVNVLRALYRDSCLGESVMSYASEGLKIAIRGFQGISWAMRNAATLLFSTLMTRVFGVSRSRDEVQRKNCMTGRVFFFRFPDLFEFLLNELKSCVAALRTNSNNTVSSLQPSLYPILLLLGRLYPSTIEGSDSNLKLTAFVPYLRQCIDSAIWKTRILAAKALVPLLSPDEYLSILTELFSSLPTLFYDRQQNRVHGVLLQILHILKEVPHLPVAQQRKVKKMLPAWVQSNLRLSQSCNSCYTTRAAFMEIVYFSLLENLMSVAPSTAGSILKDLLEEIKPSSCPPGKVQFIVLSVYVSLLSLLQQASMESFFVDIFPTNSFTLDHFVIDLLTSPFYEARVVTLQFLLWIMDNTMSYVNSDDFVLLKRVNWNMPCFRQQKTKLKNLVTDSKNMSTCLVSLLMRETHPGCLARIYQLMFLMYDAGSVNWISLPFKTSVTCVEKLQWVLDCFQKCKNDDVKNAMLLFSSSLAKLVYDALFQSVLEALSSAVCVENGDHLMVCAILQLLHSLFSDGFLDFSANNHEVLVRWIAEVENSALSDQSFSRRSATVQVLKQVKDSVLMDTQRSLGHSVFHLWQALLHLLEDDEPDIKRMAGEIIVSIRNASNNTDLPVYALPVVPAKAIEFMVMLFVERFGQSIPSECFSMLVAWMLRSEGEELEFQGDEQPFDKGEMNVFAEDFALTVLVKDHLHGFLRLHKQPKELKILISLVPSWKTSYASDKLEYICIADCVKRCLHETSDLVKKLTSQDDHAPLINRQFDQTSLRISQHVEVISTLMDLCSPAVQSEFCPYLESILEMLSSIKYLNRFLNDVTNCIVRSLLSLPRSVNT